MSTGNMNNSVTKNIRLRPYILQGDHAMENIRLDA